MARPQTITGNALYDINGLIKPGWLAVQHWARFARAQLEYCAEYKPNRISAVMDALAVDAGWLLEGGHHRKFKGDPEFAREQLHDISTGTLVYDDALLYLDDLADAAQPSSKSA